MSGTLVVQISLLAWQNGGRFKMKSGVYDSQRTYNAINKVLRVKKYTISQC